MRKHFFVNENDGYLTSEQNRQQPIRNPITGSIKKQFIHRNLDVFRSFKIQL